MPKGKSHWSDFQYFKKKFSRTKAAFFMHYVYILQSLKKGKFYIGETPDVSARLIFHNTIEKNTNSTKSGIPWEVFWKFEVQDRIIARKIEAHISL